MLEKQLNMVLMSCWIQSPRNARKNNVGADSRATLLRLSWRRALCWG